MKLTLRLLLMLGLSMLTSTLVNFLLTLLIFDVPVRGSHVDSVGAAFLNFCCNFGGLMLFTWLVYMFVIRRLKALGRVTRDVANGDYSGNLPTKGNDEISELTEDFNSMTHALKASEYLNKEYVKNVSHELKTPLSAVKGYAELLAGGDYPPEKVKAFAAVIASEVDKLITMSGQMLSMSRLESVSIVKKEDTVKVDEQVREVILLMQNDWTKKNIELDLELQPIEITGNSEMLRLIWQNLFSNAVKFSRESGRIAVRLRREGDRLLFELKDDGIGIADEHKPYIFRQFYTAERGPDGKNTGIGLSLAKKVVEKLGGEIRFESELNAGTTFFVTLPI